MVISNIVIMYVFKVKFIIRGSGKYPNEIGFTAISN